jgi:hypothetical protein
VKAAYFVRREVTMDATLLSSRDLMFYALPIVILFFASVLRLDEMVTKRKKIASSAPAEQRRPRRTSMLSDPDGHPWEN